MFSTKAGISTLTRQLACVIGLMLFALPPAILSEPAVPGQLRAALIVNFIRYIEWPEEDQLTQFHIGLQNASPGLRESLEFASRNVQVRGKAIQVTELRNLQFDASEYQVVYEPDPARVAEMARHLRSTGTLLITDGSDLRRDFMINITNQQSTMGFEVNRSNLVFERLKVNRDILLLGGTELDVAELFRETEEALRLATEQFQAREAQLARLEPELQAKQQALNEKTRLIDELNRSLVAQQKMLDERGAELARKAAEVSVAEAKLASRQAQLLQSQEELEANQLNVATSLLRISEITTEIDRNREVLKQQETELQRQSRTIAQYAETVSDQQEIVRLSILLSLVFGGLLLTLFWSYLARRKGHQQLLLANAELETARRVAEVATQAKSAFLARISHEIRTPMNAILGFAHLLRQDPQLTPKQAEHLDVIHRNGEHLLLLIDDVLDMSRIEAGQMTVHEEEFDLFAAAGEIRDMFLTQVSEKGLLLDLVLAPGLPRWIISDQKKVRQIITNLLGNAVKFTRQGSVTLKLACDPGNGEMLVIEVADTGKGIAESEQGSVYGVFEQTQTGARASSGSGLGLAIVRELVSLLEGDVSFVSAVDVGTTFRVSLPLKEGKPQTTTSLGAEAEQQVIGIADEIVSPRLLVVDDNASNRQLVINMLQRVGLTVHEADSAETGLEMLEAGTYDLLLLDLQMPGMTGDVALQKLRQNPRFSKLPVIIVTANELMGERDRLLQLGANGFVRKPFRPKEMFDHLAALLDINWLYAETKNTRPETPAAAVPLRKSSAETQTPAVASVMIVDDNPDIRELCERFAGRLGVEVVLVSDGIDALPLWQTHHFQLVLTDCSMPIMDGYELTREIRLAEAKLALAQPTIIVAITGSGSRDRELCVEAGMDDVLKKPFTLQDFEDVFMRYLVLGA